MFHEARVGQAARLAATGLSINADMTVRELRQFALACTSADLVGVEQTV